MESCDTIRIATKNETKQTWRHKAFFTHDFNFEQASLRGLGFCSLYCPFL